MFPQPRAIKLPIIKNGPKGIISLRVFFFKSIKAILTIEPTKNPKNIAKILIEKHRNGPTGTIKFFFEGSQASFKTIEQHRNLPPGM